MLEPNLVSLPSTPVESVLSLSSRRVYSVQSAGVLSNLAESRYKSKC